MGSRPEIPFFPQREPTDPHGRFLTEPMTRRSFLNRAGRVSAGVVIAGSWLTYTDTVVGDRFWGGTHPETGIIPNKEAAEKFPHTWTLAIGGYNVDDPDKIAEAISPAMAKFSQVGYIKPSNEGLQIDDMKRSAERFVEENGIENLYVYGHSMGGMIGLELSAHLAKNGVNVLGNILDCSPLKYEDIYENKRTGADALITAESIKLRGGPLTRLGIELFTRLRDGRRDIVQLCAEAVREVTPEGCSNKLIQSQASYMSEFNIENYADSFPATTKFIYLMPEHAWSDTTINNTTAHTRLKNTFSNYRVVDAPVIGGAHANPRNCQDGYREALLKAAEDCVFPDGRQIPPPTYHGPQAIR